MSSRPQLKTLPTLRRTLRASAKSKTEPHRSVIIILSHLNPASTPRQAVCVPS